MEALNSILTGYAVAALSVYALWFYFLSRRLTGPKVLPFVGSLPYLIANRSRIHDWIADNLRATGGTYQTCTMVIPFVAKAQGFYTVTCHPKNVEHILKTRFDNYPKGPMWRAAFHDLLGQGIFNSDGDTWLMQRKTAALEFTTRTLRQAMARWVNGTIKNRLWLILDRAVQNNKPVDLQDLFLRLTFDNICGLTFGKDPETLSLDLPDNPFSVAFDTATEATLKRLLYTGFLWRIQKAMGIGSEDKLKKSRTDFNGSSIMQLTRSSGSAAARFTREGESVAPKGCVPRQLRTPFTGQACQALRSGQSASDDDQLDSGALIKYLAAPVLQTGIMTGALWTLGVGAHALETAQSLPGGIDGADAAKALVALYFLVTSIKSRIFSPLPADRPTVRGETKDRETGLKRPWWTPPPLTFPIVWSTIGVLRCVAAVMVWEACGRDTTAWPLIVYCAHLAIGDAWNHINVYEKRPGVAVPGVLCCWASVLAVTAAYYSVDQTAGLTIAPSAVWISIASVLIWQIWEVNDRPGKLYPTKGESRAVAERLAAQGATR